MKRTAARRSVAPVAAVFYLNHHSQYVHWHFFQMSVANIAVIVVMLIVFAIAIMARFPSGGVGGNSS